MTLLPRFIKYSLDGAIGFVKGGFGVEIVKPNLKMYFEPPLFIGLI